MRKEPLRKCILTNVKAPKTLLIRIVRTPEEQVKIDLTGKLNGRGVYISKTVTDISKLLKSKKIEKTLGVEIPEHIYLELEKILIEK